MATKKKATNKRWGYKEISLPADEYGFDEDGWILVRSRLTVQDGLDAAGMSDENAIAEWLPRLIGGWSIKADGMELEYIPENCMLLPIEILQLVQEQVTGPLQVAQTDSPKD